MAVLFGRNIWRKARKSTTWPSARGELFRDSQSVSRSDTATAGQYRHEKCTSISTQWIAPREGSAFCIVADKTTRSLRGLLCRML